MPVKEVAYRLTVDGKTETKRAFMEVGADGRAAGQSIAEGFKDAGDEAERSATRAQAAYDRQMVAWKAQAAKALEIQKAMERNAQFDSFFGVGGIRKSAEDSARVFEEAFEGGLTRLQKASRLNLSRQAADIFTMAAMGASPTMIGVSQGPQILDAWSTAGLKLTPTLLAATTAVAGLGVVAGTMALQVKQSNDAWEGQIKAQREAIDVGGQLEKINNQLATASMAMVPVLKAEAAALREGAKAAYDKAQAERARRLSEAQDLVAAGVPGVLTGKRFDELDRLIDAYKKDTFRRSAATKKENLDSLISTVNDAQRQLESGLDSAGRALTKGARQALKDAITGAAATARSEIDRLTPLRDQYIKEKKLEPAGIIGGELDSAYELAQAVRGKAAPAGRTRSGASSADAAARQNLRDQEEALRLQEEAERRLNALTDVRLQFQLKLAKIGGDSTDLLDREISFRQMISQLEAAGLDKEEARAEASKQVRLEVEAEAKARQAPLKGFVPAEVSAAAFNAQLAKLTVPTALELKMRAIGDVFGDSLHDGLMAAANDDSFFGAFRDRLKYSIMQAFADRATTSTLALLFGDQDRGGDTPGLLKTGVKFASSFFGHNAQGTDNWRGGPTWVGEEGPELVDLPRGSKVFSAPRSAAMATGGGGQPIVFDLRGAVVTADLLAQMQQLANGAESRAVVRSGQQAGAQAYDYMTRNNLMQG
jgi:hypothetical protein